MLVQNIFFGMSFFLLLHHAAAQTSGSFNVLSMNVAGLPAILNGNGDGQNSSYEADWRELRRV